MAKPAEHVPDSKKIVVTKDGPCLVYGGAPLAAQTIGVNKEGASVEWIEGRELSAENKPFCSGAHAADPKFDDGRVQK